MTSFFKKLLQHRVLQDISFLTMAAWVSQALLLYRSYLIPDGLGPEGYGIWRITTLILFYCTFTHLGTVEGFQREAPLLRGQGNDGLARIVGETTWSFWNLMSLVAMGCLIGYAFLTRYRHDPVLTHCLYLTAPLLLQQSISYFLSARLCTEIRFTPVSISMLLNAVANVLGIWVLQFLRQFTVLNTLWIFFCANCLTIGYLSWHARFQWLAPIQFRILRRLVSMGFPITLFLVLCNTLTTVDQWLVLKLRGATEMGIYGLGFSLMMILARVPSMVSTAIEPRFLEYTGRHGLTARSSLFISEQVAVLGLFVPLFAGLAAIGIPPMIRQFLPEFGRSIPIMHSTLVGFAAFSLTYPLKSMIVLRKIQWHCVPIPLGGLALCVVLDLVALAIWKDRLVPVAVASSFSYLLVSIALVWYVVGEGLAERPRGAIGFFAGILGSLAGAALAVFGLLHWLRLPGNGFGTEMATVAVQGALFALTYGTFSFWRGRSLYRRISRLAVE